MNFSPSPSPSLVSFVRSKGEWNGHNTLHVIKNLKIHKPDIIWESKLQWVPCGLRPRSEAAWFLGSGFESRLGRGCSSVAFVLCCVGSGLCDGLTAPSGKSYRICACVCVSVCLCLIGCHLETSKHGGLGSTCSAEPQKNQKLSKNKSRRWPDIRAQ